MTFAVSGLNRVSGIEATPESQELARHPRMAARYRLEILSVELLCQVMKYLPDMAALSRLFTAYPTMIPPFEAYRNEIVSSVMNNKSPELRNSALECASYSNLLANAPKPYDPFHQILSRRQDIS